MNDQKISSRRHFLIQTLKKSGQVAIASSVIYSISLVQGKGPFGNLAAGAKCCPGSWVMDGARCAPYVRPSDSRCEEGVVNTGVSSSCRTDWSWSCH